MESNLLIGCKCDFYTRVFFMGIQVFKMFEQGDSSAQGSNFFSQKKKVRPCFIRLMRDKEVDQRLSKKSKKNETEVMSYFVFS